MSSFYCTDFSAIWRAGLPKRWAGLLFVAQGGARRNRWQQDWAAVARAIDTRLAELNWRQRELAERAQVSVAIVRELHRNTTQRHRNARTLEALSLALGWHPEHLDAVLRGHTPPDRGAAGHLAGGPRHGPIDLDRSAPGRH